MAITKTFLVSLCVTCFAQAYSQAGPNNLAAVPDAVKNKANIVTYVNDISFDVEGLDKATLKVHKIFTILNEEGEREQLFTQYSTKDISLEDAEIRVYDALGKQTGKYKKKDMRTTATGEGLIEEGNLTYYHVSGAYPLTVEWSYEMKFRNTLSFPDFRFIGLGEGLVESNYTARVPAGMNLRYKPVNTNIQPAITDDGKFKIYKWTVKNMPPIEYEEGAVDISNRYPHLLIASDQFSYYGLQGDLSSWKSFGAWISTLYTGLDVLPPDRQQFYNNLVKDAPDDREKIRRIYRYMQENFRYVSIQLGIGGLKPFPADFTDKKKYGDCKALSNYMKAALKSVGINSYVAIINAEYNQEPVDPLFPSNEFNHVILCVPQKNDSIWLECTSSAADFNVLGTFTENRNALLITEQGGVLVPTPRSKAASNQLFTTTRIELAPDLSGKTETMFRTRGEYRELLEDMLKGKKDEQKEALVYYFGFKQPDQFVLSETSGTQEDGVTSKLNMEVMKMPEFTTGNKWFINPRFYKIWSGKLPKSDNRKLDFYFRFPFEKFDTCILKLPEGAKAETLPAEKTLSCSYASYHSKCWYNEKENAVYTATSFTLLQHKIPASDYAGVRKFFDDVLQDDTQKIVILTSDGAKKGF